jgi:glycosyltransferase involved in cell wall biosynthesis
MSALSMAKRVLIICPYPRDTVPGQRLKYEQYLAYIENSGYEVTILPFFSEATFRILYRKGYVFQKIIGVLAGFCRRIVQVPRIRHADGIYIFLNVVPIGPSLFEKLYLRLAKRVIYDIDDMVHQLKTSPQNQWVRFFRSDRRFFLLMKYADHVITCTPELDRLVRSFNSSTTDISSSVDTDRYIPVNRYQNDHQLLIGWSGSHSTLCYLNVLKGVFQRLAKDLDFKLLVMGSGDFAIEGVNVESRPWSTNIEIETLQRMDIGVYPLPDDDWVKGKSGLKAIQYMSLGIPVVASYVGCNDRVIENGVTGFLVTTDESWYQHLRLLLLEPSLRKRMGQQGRARVERLFSVRANQATYLKIFDTVYDPARNRIVVD